MFFRMRRQHAFELNQSLERAKMERESTCLSSNGLRSSSRPSSKDSNGGGPVIGRGGDRGGQRGDYGSEGDHNQALSVPPSGHEIENGVRKRGV